MTVVATNEDKKNKIVYILIVTNPFHFSLVNLNLEKNCYL